MDIVVPELGESIVEATVAHWLKKEGDPVSAGEALVSLETDKVDLDVSAPQDGVLARIDRQEGEDVAVGQVLGAIQPAGTPPSKPTGQAAGEAVAMPSGAQAGKASPQTPPVAAEAAPAPQTTSETTLPGPEEAPTPARPSRTDGGSAARLSPVAQRFAEEHGLDISQIPASTGRLTKEDLERYLETRASLPPPPASAQTQAPAQSTPQPPTPSPQPPSSSRPEERIRMSRRRRTIASRLVEAQQTAAMLTTFNDVDMSAVIEVRNRRKDSFQQRHGVKLGFMSFFVKAAIGALKAFPMLNAEIQGDEMITKRYYDIGIAIGAPEGLVVPVLRDADKLSFAAIESAIKKFGQQAEDNTLALEDLRGGTFSITNGGVFGSLLSTPILNPPQVGILGMHRIEERPIARDGEILIRPMMYLALSYDHRIVDGREAVQFLVRLKELIEDPESLLLEG